MKILKKGQYEFLQRCCYDTNWDIDEKSVYSKYLVNGERIAYIGKGKQDDFKWNDERHIHCYALMKPLQNDCFEVVLQGSLDVIETYLIGRLTFRERLLIEIERFYEHVSTHEMFMKVEREMAADKAIVTLYEELKSGSDCLLEFEHCAYIPGKHFPKSAKAELRWLGEAVSDLIYGETPSECHYEHKPFPWHYNFKFNSKKNKE